MIETYASDDLYKTINGSLQETDPQMNVILVAILLTQCQKKKKKSKRELALFFKIFSCLNLCHIVFFPFFFFFEVRGTIHKLLKCLFCCWIVSCIFF